MLLAHPPILTDIIHQMHDVCGKCVICNIFWLIKCKFLCLNLVIMTINFLAIAAVRIIWHCTGYFVPSIVWFISNISHNPINNFCVHTFPTKCFKKKAYRLKRMTQKPLSFT
eukprot:NODE_428_length_8761_cov_0.779612.p7 type:complete len:112 gc:universal NODE_428_length_8761_cov_0.779612:2102-2437(+)